MNDNYLVVLCSHIDSEQKKQTVIETLKELKNDSIDVCFSTHSSQYLDEISQYVKYVIYDNNNEYVFRNDYLYNVDLLGDNQTQFGVTTYVRYESFGSVYEFHPGSPHSKSALLLLKNGISISKINKYKWTIYLEYDIKSPKSGFKTFFEEKLLELKTNNKKCFYYQNVNGLNFLWGGLFIFETEKIFNNDLLMNTDWFSNKKNWISTFKLGFFESIVEYNLNNTFTNDETIKKPITEDTVSIWGFEDYLDIQRYGFDISLFKHNRELKKIVTVNLCPFKLNGLKFLIMFAHNTDNLTTVNVKNLTVVSTDGSLNYDESFTLAPSTWCIHYFDVTNVNIENNIKLFCELENDLENTFLFEKINLNQFDIIYDKLIRVE